MFLSQHIYAAVRAHAPAYMGNILEIGAFEGEGTRQLAQSFPNRTIYVIDPFIEDGNTVASTQVSRGEAMPTQRAAYLNNTQDLTNVRLFDCTSKDFMSVRTDLTDLDIGCVIVDGSHHLPDVRLDGQLAMRCLAHRPGIVVFDDLTIADVEQAVKEFVQVYQHRIHRAHDIHGVAVILEIKHVN